MDRKNGAPLTERNPLLDAFQEQVAIKYQLYNSLFVTLPFAHLTDVGVELPLFAELCSHELAKGKSPRAIIQNFFKDIAHTEDFNKQANILFLLLQFVERQVVLFDALEDAAFTSTHDVTNIGSLPHFIKSIAATHQSHKALQLLQKYRTRLVLTAHPTQFYPFQVLGIIQDLAKAIKRNNVKTIRDLLLQLGKTSFKNTTSPTPLDEANVLIYYLEHIFYPVMKKLQSELNLAFFPQVLPAVFELGFWPGGDRDGNPNVTADITLQVAHHLKSTIINLYIKEIKILKRRLTFHNMWSRLDTIKEKLNNEKYDHSEALLTDLVILREELLRQDDGLFIEYIDDFISAIHLFGFYFATLDLRQNSDIHSDVIQALWNADYNKLSCKDKITYLLQMLNQRPSLANRSDNVFVQDVIASLKAMRQIQKTNGEKACHRYIISNTHGVHNILEVMLLAYTTECFNLDIVPLFETISDLDQAHSIMQELYQLPLYQQHLKKRNNCQIVMLGFSDGTKDGGYVTANWAIFKCKKALFELSEKLNIEIIFFDGRGGPPARGGGNTHKFYRAMEGIIEQKQIQLTIQGQTISSNFGTLASASYNIEQLFTSGLIGPLFGEKRNCLTVTDYDLLEKMSELGFDCYQKLKNHPVFTTYLEKITPLLFYAELNITSRPVRRQSGGALRFEDLRAIPFVGSWSQIKQNVPGYYGLGTALKTLIDAGYETALKNLYQRSLYFRTLLENAMQSLLKCNFSLTQNLREDPQFGEFWCLLQHEALLTTEMLKQVSEQGELLANDPINRNSILMREKLVLPLLVIQQYAMAEIINMDQSDPKYRVFYKLILKSLAANINASRNSA